VATNITPANAAVAISPTGTGTVTINPATASTINNTSIGATTAATGRFTSVTATTGSFVVGTAGQGIDFSATPGTGTSELLADYEEGEWTAAFVPSTSGTITMNNATGTYTKVGRVVTVNGLLTVTSVSSPLGYLQITGLPFSGGSAASKRCALAINNENMNITMTTVLVANIQGGSIIYVFKNDGSGSIAITTAADVQAGTNIFIGGTYTTD
jgi:hypothetical protein